MTVEQPWPTVLAAFAWRTNADLIADVHALGYLRDDDRVLDPTYGKAGGMWRKWRPEKLTCHDLALDGVDFRALPYPDRSFDAVVFDPPYKLNGTGAGATDERYGVADRTNRHDRHALARAGIAECARVRDRTLLVKCMDQVSSGKVRWQTREFADHAEAQGFALVDRFDLLAHRPQPEGRRQLHAARNYSTLLVLDRSTASRSADKTRSPSFPGLPQTFGPLTGDPGNCTYPTPTAATGGGRYG